MERINLGRSGLSVPRLCLGTNNFGGGQLGEETASKIMSRALDLGINFFDTASVYTRGNSEKVIGKFAKGRRDDVIIATKAGAENDVPNRSSVSRSNLLYRIKQSLENFETDYIDLFYVHRFDAQIPLEETMTTLHGLVREGKVRYIACSNYTVQQIEESRKIAERLGLENFIAVQNEYNLFERTMETSVIPYCSKNGIGTLGYSPLASGVLAGRYEQGKLPPQGSRATYKPEGWLAAHVNEEKFRKLELIKELASKSGLSLTALALSWALRKDGVMTAIVGASRPEQLDECAKAVDTRLQSEIINDLKTAL
jgi:aryl-alcohol dehydrogenase-like predicted oxidoreductase